MAKVNKPAKLTSLDEIIRLNKIDQAKENEGGGAGEEGSVMAGLVVCFLFGFFFTAVLDKGLDLHPQDGLWWVLEIIGILGVVMLSVWLFP